jgi:hypothetical protein
MNETAFSLSLSAMLVSVLLSAVIPIVTGLITKSSLSGWVKGLITLVLNYVSAAVVQATIADGGAFFSRESLIMSLIGLSISVATYAGIYQPANLTSSDADGKLLPRFGIG